MIKIELTNQEALQLAGIIRKPNNDKGNNLLSAALREQVRILENKPSLLKLKSIFSLMIDFIDQGWEPVIKYESSNINNSIVIYMQAMDFSSRSESAESIKNKMREGLQIGAKENLLKEDTQKFIKKMHAETKYRKSIDVIIDSSKDLLEECLNIDHSKTDALKEVIDPYIQTVTPGLKDTFTNHYVNDIWRYFRLTWSLEHKSNPGRSMGFLIRNRARDNHPVIGISMLASPVLGLGARDEELGLTVDSFLSFVQKQKMSMEDLIEMIQKDLSRSLRFLKVSDIASKDDLKKPNAQTLTKTMHTYDRAIEKKDMAKKMGNDAEYEKYLYIAKRAIKLNQLLKQKIAVTALKKDTKKFKLSIEACYKNEAFKDIIRKFILSKRTAVMATDVMDLSVCGAVFPYNKLIGGKLVALLMGSSEVNEFFNAKYGSSENEIATKMAGRSIRKKSLLRCITTTSLYGTHSSQYNRLRLKMGKGKNPKILQFKKLRKKTEGYGTFHFSNNTLKALDQYYQTSGSSSSINYKFGEGSSPRLRRLRESMSYLGFKGDEFYKHKQQRIVYLLNLDKNLVKSIFGLAEYRPNLYPASKINSGWRQRWLEKRIQNPEIQKSMKKMKKEDSYLTHWLPSSKQDLFNKKEK